MSRIVIITSHMAGRINTTCELTRRLRDLGHDVTLASPVDIGERVAAQGMDFLYIGPETPVPTRSGPKPGYLPRLGALVVRLRTLPSLSARRHAAVTKLNLEALEALLSDLAADLYLVDIELPVQIMAASRTDAPVAVWTTMLSLWKRPGLPPLHTDIVPGVGFRGSRVGIEWAWIRFRLWKWLRYQRHRITRVGTDQYAVLREVASRLSYPIKRDAARYHWLIPFVYRNLPTLMFNAREIEFPHDPDPVCSYVGPILNASRRAAGAGEYQIAMSEVLEAVYERRRKGRTSALIYCSFGAWHSGNDADFFRRVIEAMGRRPDWEAVVGLGGRVDPELIGEVPDNVNLFAWAPQMEVLAHADLAIHHAGISSINESVVSAVPMIVYPYDYGDTSGAAARVVFHEIGLRGDRVADEVDTIYETIDSLLTEPRFRSNIERMRDAFAEYERNDVAVKAIERLIRSEGAV